MLRQYARLILILAGIVVVSAAGQNSQACGAGLEFAYFGKDQNIYLYNLCTRKNIRLTQDNLPLAPTGLYNLGYYLFFDEFRAWSPNGKYLVFGFGPKGTGFLLNVETRKLAVLGAVKYATWSPSGQYLAVSRLQEHYLPEVNDEILLVDPDKLGYLKRLNGYAPIWQNDKRLFYLSAVLQNDKYSLVQQAYMYDLKLSESISVPVTVNPGNSFFHTYAERGQISPDGKIVAIHIPATGLDGVASFVSLFNLQTYQAISSTMPTDEKLFQGGNVRGVDRDYRWSPKQPILAICIGNLGDQSLYLFRENRVIRVEGSACARTGWLSWHPTGKWLAYLNTQKGIGLIDINGKVVLDTKGINVKGVGATEVVSGVWWSPDGNFISAIANEKICVAPVRDVTKMEFECVVEGSEMAWRP